MDFKWIGFLIEWILNGLDHRKNGLDHKNWIFCPPLLKNEPGWVVSLNHQPVVGRAGSGRITRFDSSNRCVTYSSYF